MSPDDALSLPNRTLDRTIQDHLGHLLRASLDDVTHEAVPQRFLALLAELERVLDAGGQSVGAELRGEVLALVPSLRAFARSLTRDPDRADDLVQDTLERAFRSLHRFEPGTSMSAWLFTIARNQFNSYWRKAKREVPDPEGVHAAALAVAPGQIDTITLREMRDALDKLPADQRRALLLITVDGRSIEEAAEALGCAEGTIKSRVHRARAQLTKLLGLQTADDLGHDGITRAAMG